MSFLVFELQSTSVFISKKKLFCPFEFLFSVYIIVDWCMCFSVSPRRLVLLVVSKCLCNFYMHALCLGRGDFSNYLQCIVYLVLSSSVYFLAVSSIGCNGLFWKIICHYSWKRLIFITALRSLSIWDFFLGVARRNWNGIISICIGTEERVLYWIKPYTRDKDRERGKAKNFTWYFSAKKSTLFILYLLINEWTVVFYPVDFIEETFCKVYVECDCLWCWWWYWDKMLMMLNWGCKSQI